jgi:hypothetical protein
MAGDYLAMRGRLFANRQSDPLHRSFDDRRTDGELALSRRPVKAGTSKPVEGILRCGAHENAEKKSISRNAFPH